MPCRVEKSGKSLNSILYGILIITPHMTLLEGERAKLIFRAARLMDLSSREEKMGSTMIGTANCSDVTKSVST
jgi:hypothetical protein